MALHGEPNRFENPTYGQSVGAAEAQTGNPQGDLHVGSKGAYTDKARSTMKIQGIMQIVLGAICFVSQVVVIIWAEHLYGCIWSFFFPSEPIPSDAAGIWCGIVFAASGVVSIIASKENTVNWVKASLVGTSISIVLVFVLLGLAFLDITDLGALLCSNKHGIPYAFDGIMVAAAGIELVVSIWSTILSCDARYSCCTDRQQFYNINYNPGQAAVPSFQMTATSTAPVSSADRQMAATSEVTVPQEKY